MKRKISEVLFIILLCVIMNPNTIKADVKGPDRIINVVYDDSGSMYDTNGKMVDTWCQAKYSMEVFAAMLGEADTLNVYYMSDYQSDTESPPRLTLLGKDGAAVNIGKLHSETTIAGNTPFNSVRKAYADLSNTSGGEKWLVILTDGAFEDGALSKSEVDAFLAQKDADIRVMFLAMGPDAAGITENAEKNIFYVEAKSSSDILRQITGICTRVFNSNRLDINASTKNFTFDVPMGELVIFAQGANVQINGIKKEDGSLVKSSRKPVEVKYSYCDATNHNNPPTEDLLGRIATFIDDFSIGDYYADVSGAETIEIFYKPNVEVAATLTDANGKEVTNLENLEAGDYTITFGFVKAGTKEEVKPSKLLGNISYEAYVTNNGKQHEKPYADGDKIHLEEGSLSIDATARYLGYNTVSTKLDYSIFKNKEVTFEVLNNPQYIVEPTGMSNDKEYIEIKAKVDGNELSEEQWQQMETPSIKLADAERDFKIEVPVIEKSDQIGVYRIMPVLPDGKPSTGTYRDCEYTLSYQQKFGNETWAGKADEVLKIADKRSWWKRNWGLVVKLAFLAAIVLLIAGYLPFIKHYLPKSLKKNPYIKCTSSEPGVPRKDRKGSFNKNRLSTILPYVAQKGTIKYVPSGVTGAPPLAVKAIKRRRMTITNYKAFAGKDNITFDGEVIKKDAKKFDTGAAVTIRVKRGDWTYVCNPNQSGR